MGALDLNTENWENLAADHSRWKSTLAQYLKSEEKLLNTAANKQAHENEHRYSTNSTSYSTQMCLL